MGARGALGCVFGDGDTWRLELEIIMEAYFWGGSLHRQFVEIREGATHHKTTKMEDYSLRHIAYEIEKTDGTKVTYSANVFVDRPNIFAPEPKLNAQEVLSALNEDNRARNAALAELCDRWANR